MRLVQLGLAFAVVLSAGVAVSAQKSPDDQYVLGPDSLPQPGVPKGKTFGFTMTDSKIFPGTTRKISVYVPAEYKPDKPACVFVSLDGIGFEAPTVFDNLISKKEMPVTVAIGIESGTVASASAPQDPRFNRTFEFDGLNDNLARFVLEEVIPEVEKQKTPDGLAIRLSKDPNDRATGGASTGGIGAFTLAWERSDEFRRVFTDIGTFVGMRGGDRYPVLVRKTEPKPIRIFMVDGVNDEWMGGPEVGDWWMSNQTMERALEFAGYAVNHQWGEETHNGRHAAAVFPDAMRWLWKDWPKPVVAGVSQNTFLKAILAPGEDWHVVSGNYEADGLITASPSGEIVFHDRAGKLLKIAESGSVVEDQRFGSTDSAIAFGADGRAYLNRGGQILTLGPNGEISNVADGIDARNMGVDYEGHIYATETGIGSAGGSLWLIEPSGKKERVDTGLNHPSGVALSPDGLWLAVSESATHWGYSYRVNADGSLQDKQRFYWFHVPDTADDSGAEAWVADRDGRLYAATRMGVQVFDHNGRVRAILPLPGGGVTGISVGGSGFDTLYVTCANRKVYARKLKIAGTRPGAAPTAVPDWGGG